MVKTIVFVQIYSKLKWLLTLKTNNQVVIYIIIMYLGVDLDSIMPKSVVCCKIRQCCLIGHLAQTDDFNIWWDIVTVLSKQLYNDQLYETKWKERVHKQKHQCEQKLKVSCELSKTFHMNETFQIIVQIKLHLDRHSRCKNSVAAKIYYTYQCFFRGRSFRRTFLWKVDSLLWGSPKSHPGLGINGSA